MKLKDPKHIELNIDGQTFIGKCTYVRPFGKDIEFVMSIDNVVNNVKPVKGELILLKDTVNEKNKKKGKTFERKSTAFPAR